MIGKIVFIFGYLGAATVWILPLHHVLQKKTGRFLFTFLILLAASYPAMYAFSGYRASANLLLAACISLGIQTMMTVVCLAKERIREERQGHQALFMLVWLLCVIAYNIFIMPFGAARYLLPAFPPLILLLLSDPAWDFTIPSRKIAILGTVSVSTLFAIASAYSDYRYAETYRTFATEVTIMQRDIGTSAQFWYVGEWGMRYYLKKAGARALPVRSTEPKVGDFVVTPEMPAFWDPDPQVQKRLAFFANRTFTSDMPLRLFNRRSHAGFYAHLWGMLPFVFSKEPDEVFTVYRVIK